MSKLKHGRNGAFRSKIGERDGSERMIRAFERSFVINESPAWLAPDFRWRGWAAIRLRRRR